MIARYTIAFDDHDWEAWERLWTDDVVFVVDGTPIEGLEALRAFMTTCLPDSDRSKHICGNPLIEVAEDGLSATAKTDVVWIARELREHDRRPLRRHLRQAVREVADREAGGVARPLPGGAATDVAGGNRAERRDDAPLRRTHRAHPTPAGRNWMLMRPPTGRAVFGTECSWERWQDPPMTKRSPPPSS